LIKPRLVVSRRLPPDVEARAARDYDAVLNADDLALDADALVAVTQNAQGLLVCAADRLTAETIARLPPTLRIVATFSVGYEHIDVVAAAARWIVVTNTPDVLTEATADIALLLMLAASRRAGEGERLIRSGAWAGWAPTHMMGIHIGGKRLGILGMGRIGRAVASRARAFGMAIHYHNRSRLPPDLEQGAVFHADPEALLAVSDVLSLHAPASPETTQFLNRRRIDLLPPQTIVVNTARGTLVDDDALIEALGSGRVLAAGLDVFTGEPNLDRRYRTLDNVFLLPHLGSATVETRNAMGFRALDNLDALLLAGSAPPDAVT
jgi:lactate dehydrogenase-like 2-hydroxyacid dehydrogenase